MTMDRVILHSVIILLLLHKSESGCYFSPELQGEFVMQNTVHPGSSIQYSTVNITSYSIAIWGNCHKRIGNNVIFLSGSGENSCLRCFRLKLRSRNVLQVYAKLGDISRCYLTEEAVISNCPSDDTPRRNLTELILFKTKDSGNKSIQYEYCPIGGKFYVNYNINDGSENKVECSGNTSKMSTCPSGTSLKFEFHQCVFEDYDLEYKCLGSWKGDNEEQYIVLVNVFNQNQPPHYRCALFKRDPNTGVIHLSMSRDSTCSTDLYNATHGHEELILSAQPEKSWPDSTIYTACRFPDWMHGNWEHLYVDNNTLVYTDHSSYQTYTMKCVGQLDVQDKFLIFGKTQCGYEMFNCMWIKERANNTLEFKMGTIPSKTDDINLCVPDNFRESKWITQGKLDKGRESPCPISGEYTGLLPDESGFCAKLWSDCRAPELMYYQVTNCDQEIYEEREYRCLGQWKEDELLYTYTQRRDVADNTYECFVGAIISERDIYIKEAGDHCQRNIDPYTNGMKLSEQGRIPTSCVDGVISSTTPSAPTTRFSTKSWTPVTHQTTPDNESNDINSGVSRQLPFSAIGFLFCMLISIKYFNA